VHGCFWHRHEGCRFTSTPSTRPEFWAAKFAANVERDQKVLATLSDEGWRVAIVWECALKKQANVDLTVEQLADWIIIGGTFIEIGEQNAGS
jgi:DNA mismatch endonuclease (patch repair protein)